jgi:hypothetical protein
MNRITHSHLLPAQRRIRARLHVPPAPPAPPITPCDPPLWIGPALIATGFLCLGIMFLVG